jgi:hypothetical protein
MDTEEYRPLRGSSVRGGKSFEPGAPAEHPEAFPVDPVVPIGSPVSKRDFAQLKELARVRDVPRSDFAQEDREESS